MTRVTVNGADITDRVIAISTDDSVSAGAQITIKPQAITVKNTDGAYSGGQFAHLPPGMNLSEIEVKIERDMGTWTGRLQAIDAHQPGLAVLTAESNLGASMSAIAVFACIGVTPAEAAAEAIRSAGLVAGPGLTTLALEQAAAGMLINAAPMESDGITVSAALAALAEMANMKFYVYGDTVDALAPHSVAPFWTIDQDDIISVSDFQTETPVVGYSVDFLMSGGVPAAAGKTVGNVWKQEYGASSWLQCCDSWSAAALGEKAMKNPRWTLALTVKTGVLFAEPGTVVHVAAPAIGVDAAVVVTGVAEDNGWYRLTMEERRT